MSKVPIRIDGSQLAEALKGRFSDIVAPKSELFREVALDLIPMIHERIHVDGLAADGTPIGTYSNEYMKVRTGNFGNSAKFKKGKNKGGLKDSGAFTRGASKGSARPKYNRNSDSKVILSLTRQMENDYAVVPGEEGWGIGFNNVFNAEKAGWNDQRYGHKVYALTEDELNYAVTRTEALIVKEMNK